MHEAVNVLCSNIMEKTTTLCLAELAEFFISAIPAGSSDFRIAERAGEKIAGTLRQV
jgi:hypothetical protein